MKLSAYMPPMATVSPKSALQEKAKHPAIQNADTFQSKVVNSINCPAQIRAGNYILNNHLVDSNEALQKKIIDRSTKYVLETTQQFVKTVLALHNSGGINLEDEKSSIFKLIPALDERFKVPAFVATLLICGDGAAHNALMTGFKKYPKLTQLFAQNFQAQQDRLSNGNVEQLRNHFLHESGSLTARLELGKPYTEMLKKYQPPLGYEVNNLIPVEGTENGAIVTLFQANLVPLLGEANFPHYIEDPIYQKKQLILDQELYTLGKKSLFSSVISEGPRRTWNTRNTLN